MVLIIIVIVLVLASIGVIDSFLRCIAFALDKTRGSFARVLVGLAGLAILAIAYALIKPFFDGSLREGLAAVAYFFGIFGPFAVAFAAAGVYASYRPADYAQKLGNWLEDQFNSRSDR